jgi:hypothetical protein
MSKKKDFILDALNVISWIIFIGLCIEAGAIIFNYIYCLIKPIAAGNIYKGLDLSRMYQDHFGHFNAVMSFIIVVYVMKAYLFYLVVKIFMQLNLVSPFSTEIAKLIENISYEAFAIAIVSFIAHQYTERLIHKGFEVSSVESYWGDAGAFLMMAGVVYVISKIFNKGIELQNETELTI